MMDDISPITRDPELARRLAALDAPPSADAVAALRARIRAAAEPQLLARRGVIPLRRPSWWDVTSSFGRVAIPLSVAAALLAMLVLRALPQVTTTDESSTMAMASTMSTSIVTDSMSSPEIADELLMPADADAVLLAPFDNGARQ